MVVSFPIPFSIIITKPSSRQNNRVNQNGEAGGMKNYVINFDERSPFWDNGKTGWNVRERFACVKAVVVAQRRDYRIA